MASAGKPLAGVGRPRRFEPQDELRLLFEATLAVMQRNGYADVAVADILAEAGMSTRSFYRHFQSKDQLLCALYRHEAEQVSERLTAGVSGAPSPLAALDKWIEEIMSLGYHRRKAARVAVLGSPGAMRAEGYADESKRAMKLLIAPLEALLADGLRDGTFPLADPARDAPLVQSVVWTAAGLNPYREPVKDQAEAFRTAQSFCWRALGVPAETPGR
ncbi:MAG TPA: TetR/AcrR family transcriptional regulator [Trebonia sp.]|jgi:AcrR family transcriptional regulator|nr:TetR/AcrR family transcriptional regulator [Trebonia sp.]